MAATPAFPAAEVIAEEARDLGIHDGTLGNWVNTWRREHPEPDQPLRMENEFLKEQRRLLRADAPVTERVCRDRRGEG